MSKLTLISDSEMQAQRNKAKAQAQPPFEHPPDLGYQEVPASQVEELFRRTPSEVLPADRMKVDEPAHATTPRLETPLPLLHLQGPQASVNLSPRAPAPVIISSPPSPIRHPPTASGRFSYSRSCSPLRSSRRSTRLSRSRSRSPFRSSRPSINFPCTRIPLPYRPLTPIRQHERGQSDFHDRPPIREQHTHSKRVLLGITVQNSCPQHPTNHPQYYFNNVGSVRIMPSGQLFFPCRHAAQMIKTQGHYGERCPGCGE